MSADGLGGANSAPADLMLTMGSLRRFLTNRGISGDEREEILGRARRWASNGRIDGEATFFLPDQLAAAFLEHAESPDEQFAICEQDLGH